MAEPVITTAIHNDAINPVGGGKKVRNNEDRLRHSNFFITINTNKPVQDEEDPVFIALDTKTYEAIMGVFAPDKILGYLTNTRKGMAPDDFSNVEIEISGAREIGEYQRRLHYHVLVATKHHCLLRFNTDKARVDLKQALGFPVYVNVKGFSSASANIYDYIYKKIKF